MVVLLEGSPLSTEEHWRPQGPLVRSPPAVPVLSPVIEEESAQRGAGLVTVAPKHNRQTVHLTEEVLQAVGSLWSKVPVAPAVSVAPVIQARAQSGGPCVEVVPLEGCAIVGQGPQSSLWGPQSSLWGLSPLWGPQSSLSLSLGFKSD
uniref:Uncharacterized protein n=1 Tax=Knipowitschia caucasica TaxID=637954 RepID=A0AAV2KK80_KNICA